MSNTELVTKFSVQNTKCFLFRSTVIRCSEPEDSAAECLGFIAHTSWRNSNCERRLPHGDCFIGSITKTQVAEEQTRPEAA